MTSKLSLELKALDELQKLNVDKLYGKQIDELVRLSTSRRQGAEKLGSAYDSFSAEKMILAERYLDEAILAFTQAREGYSTINKLQDVVTIIDAQLAEAATLQRSIALWWQGKIFERLNQARLLLVAPTTKSGTEKATEPLREAKRLLQEWQPKSVAGGKSEENERLQTLVESEPQDVPAQDQKVKTDGKTTDEKEEMRSSSQSQDKPEISLSVGETETIYEKTKEAIREVEKLLEGKDAELVRVRIAEVEDWLQMAEGYLTLANNGGESDETQLNAGQTQTIADNNGTTLSTSAEKQPVVADKSDGDLTSVYAALSCLSQAKILLESLPPEHQQNLRSQHDDLSALARQALRLGMGEKREKIDKLVQQIDEGIQKANGDQAQFLKNKENCNLIDKLRYNLYLFPDISLPAKVQQAIRQRVDNVQESRRILWQVQEEKAKKGAYWAYRELERAKDLNPGDKEIENVFNEQKRQWDSKNQQFKNLVDDITKGVNSLKKSHFETLAQNGSSGVDSKMEELRGLYESEEKRPDSWEEDFNKAKRSVEWGIWWLEVADKIKTLAERWKSSEKVNNALLKDTQQVIDEIKQSESDWPSGGKAALEDAISNVLNSKNGNEAIPDPSMIQDILKLKDQLSKGGVS